MNTSVINGYYTFDILMYKVNSTNDMELVQHFSNINTKVSNNFVKEFSVHKLDDIGMHVQFVIIDTTAYLPGMRPLAFLAWPNNSDVPIVVKFKFNTTENMELRRVEFDVPRFKSCVVEYDISHMKGSLLT